MRKFAFVLLMILFVFSACNSHSDIDSSQKETDESSSYASTSIEKDTVNTFSVSDYINEINNFSIDRIVMPVDSPQQACEMAEEIWLDIYGSTVLEEKPYVVYFDNENGIWLVHGTLPDNMLGGVAYVLIEENGKVLAVWHEK